MRAWLSRYRGDWLAVAVLLLAVFILFQPMLTHMLWGRGFDYPLHLQYVRDIRAGTMPMLAYPVFHLSVIATMAALPDLQTLRFLEGYKRAAQIVGLGLYMLTAAALYSGYTRPAYRRATLTTLAQAALVALLLMLLAPINIVSWREGHLYWGYFLPNIHFNPTLMALKPFALLLFVYIVGAFSQAAYFRTWLAVAAAFVLSLLATFAKPNFAIAYLPVLPLYALYRLYHKQPVNWRLLIGGLIVPAGTIVAYQALAFGSDPTVGGPIIFAPLASLQYHGVQGISLKLLLSIAFPAAVYIAYFRQARADVSLSLAWLIFAVGASYTYLLVESRLIADANFSWSGHVSVTVLFAASMLFFLRQVQASGFSRTGLAVGVVLALHGLGGLFWYYADSVSPGFVWY